MSKTRSRPIAQIAPALLRRHPLPAIDEQADKNARGVVLIVGGSTSVPGAILLSGLAALRAGAGKLQFGAPSRIAIPLGMAVPESLVAAESQINSLAKKANAVLVGPGMADSAASVKRATRIARALDDDATLILDATAIPAVRAARRAIVTPHVNEMAHLLDRDPEEIKANAPDIALEAAARFGCVVALKGPTTFVTDGERVFQYDGGSVGLATSGSGDILSGLVAGLSAAGADPLAATMWGVWTHGTAGRRLSKALARVGFIARELLEEVPRVLDAARR